MQILKEIRIVKGSGGFGGPLIVKPTSHKNKVLFVTGGSEPRILKHVIELSGLIPVNGFKTRVPDDEIALAIVDCGGTVRCGVYPKKGIPTVNIRNTGQSGPFAKFIVPDIYVSGVTKDSQITLLGED